MAMARVGVGVLAFARSRCRMASSLNLVATAPPLVPLVIGGKLVESHAAEWLPVTNPATGETVARTPISTPAEMDLAVSDAQAAFATWRSTPVPTRSRVMLKLQQLIREETPALAAIITREQGKTLRDAQGDVFRGLEVVEAAAGMASQLVGNYATVAFGICPFNFPAMIPLWMFPRGCTAGNTFVLKPSEKCPSAAVLLAQLALEAGMPPGVLNVLHGGSAAVDHLCTAKAVRAVAFVGSTHVGRHVFATATAEGKRVAANLGAKNHAVIMPDASPSITAAAITAAAFGAAGQRCMAISAVVMVGDDPTCAAWEEELVRAASSLRIGPGTSDVDMGPLITRAAVDRLHAAVNHAEAQGARVILDGRGAHVSDPACAAGHWFGPTILAHVTPSMECYQSELFGPVLVLLRAANLDAALALVNDNAFGNGAAIFTQSGAAARRFEADAHAGMIGVNVAIPVPLPFAFNFTGAKGSFLGEHYFYGPSSNDFFTKTKTVTSRWDSGEGAGLAFNSR